MIARNGGDLLLSHKDFSDCSMVFRVTRDIKLLVKRVIDIVASGLGLLLLSPLFLLTSLAILIESRGPVFVVTYMYYYNNRQIRTLRFRCQNHLTETLVGSFLIRRGLDRLPMLVNVLRGEMSIVGPHCHSTFPVVPLSDEQLLVLSSSPFRPGLVSFEIPQRVGSQIDADLFYVANRSLLLDAKILLMNLSSKLTNPITCL